MFVLARAREPVPHPADDHPVENVLPLVRGQAVDSEELWLTLSREEIESVSCGRGIVAALSFQDQRPGDVLAGLQCATGQEYADT
jgi:hypothetical protein